MDIEKKEIVDSQIQVDRSIQRAIITNANIKDRNKIKEGTSESQTLRRDDKDHNSYNSENQLYVKISQTLKRKLISKAQQEGVSLSELVSELLAEGLVLRAWEIVERKAAMRGGKNDNSNSNLNNRAQNSKYSGRTTSGSSYSSGRSRYVNNQNSSMQHGQNISRNTGSSRKFNYNQIMDDSANFLEYVRSQEKNKCV